jgi:hypothetical protein
MKKSYEKPSFVRREKLSKVTAGGDSLIVIPK